MWYWWYCTHERAHTENKDREEGNGEGRSARGERVHIATPAGVGVLCPGKKRLKKAAFVFRNAVLPASRHGQGCEAKRACGGRDEARVAHPVLLRDTGLHHVGSLRVERGSAGG